MPQTQLAKNLTKIEQNLLSSQSVESPVTICEQDDDSSSLSLSSQSVESPVTICEQDDDSSSLSLSSQSVESPATICAQDDDSSSFLQTIENFATTDAKYSFYFPVIETFFALLKDDKQFSGTLELPDLPNNTNTNKAHDSEDPEIIAIGIANAYANALGHTTVQEYNLDLLATKIKLGKMYEEGINGVAQNYDLAIEQFKEVAFQTENAFLAAKAYYELGMLLYKKLAMNAHQTVKIFENTRKYLLILLQATNDPLRIKSIIELVNYFDYNLIYLNILRITNNTIALSCFDQSRLKGNGYAAYQMGLILLRAKERSEEYNIYRHSFEEPVYYFKIAKELRLSKPDERAVEKLIFFSKKHQAKTLPLKENKQPYPNLTTRRVFADIKQKISTP